MAHFSRPKMAHFEKTVDRCHTQAKSLDVLMKRVKEAIELCLEIEDPAATEFVGVQRVAVPG